MKVDLFYPDSAGDTSAYTLLHSIFCKLVSTFSYLDRAESIKQFNSRNKWRKQGISCVPLIFRVEPGQLHEEFLCSMGPQWSRLEELKSAKDCGLKYNRQRLLLSDSCGHIWGKGLLDRVCILQADTLNLIQGGLTAGSTGSEASCAATLQACNMLTGRLKPVLDRLQQQSENVSWDTLISQVIYFSLIFFFWLCCDYFLLT